MMKLQDGILKAIAAELDRGGRSCRQELRPGDRCDLKMGAFGTTRIDRYWSGDEGRSACLREIEAPAQAQIRTRM